MNYVVESERIRLRKFQPDDVMNYYKMTRDPAIQKYVPYACDETIEETAESVAIYCNGDFINDFYIVIEEKSTKQMIGAIFANRMTKDSTKEVSIMTSAQFRKKGVMKEAIKLFISSLPPRTKLSFSIESSNIASIKTVTSIENIIEILSYSDLETGTLYRHFIYFC